MRSVVSGARSPGLSFLINTRPPRHLQLTSKTPPSQRAAIDPGRRTRPDPVTSKALTDQTPLRGRVGQPDYILANPIVGHKAEPRPGSGKIWPPLTKHDGVQVDSILIDQAKFGEALRQVRASNFDLPRVVGLQLTDRSLKVISNKRRVG